jgi:hypothetical protein
MESIRRFIHALDEPNLILVAGGFEILSGLLRKKSDHIDISTFRSIFGFLGCNFKHPE